MMEGKKKFKSPITWLLTVLFLILFPANAFATSATEINDFLASKGSWLANNTIAEYINVPYPVANGGTVILNNVDARQAYVDTFYNKTVAQLIYDEGVQHNINPQLILITLQKESSSVTSNAPSSDTTRAWPLFYNYDERMADCLFGDVSSCNDAKYDNPTYRERAIDYGGVGQQIAYATAQLRNLHDNASLYCGKSLVVSVDGGDLTAENAATCALYKYTPHVVSYNSDSNFYKNWVSWWGTTPNGGTSTATNTISEANFAFPVSQDPATPPPAPAPRKAGDGNGDNVVDSTDLSILADQWGKGVAANTGADFNGDAVVDSTDLSILADAWGK